MIFFIGCSKDDQTSNPNNPGASTDKPKSISIKYYNANSLLQISAYTPLTSGSSSQVGFNLNDTSYILNGVQYPSKVVFRTRVTLTLDATGNTIEQVRMQNLESSRITTLPDGRDIVIDGIRNTYANIKVDYIPTARPWPIKFNRVQITKFKDILQQQPDGFEEFNLETADFGDSNYYSLSERTGTSSDLYWVKKNTIKLEDRYISADGFSPRRNEEYFISEIPWYKPSLNNVSIYQLVSPLVCNQYLFHNGYYKYIDIDIYTKKGVFVPQIERKVNYTYSRDTTQIKELVKRINPGTIDPVWYYFNFYRGSSNGYSYFGEGYDIYNTYDWMSSSSTDSLFTFDINGDSRQLKQVATTTNTIEKDGIGRISRITRRSSSSSFNKVMEIGY